MRTSSPTVVAGHARRITGVSHPVRVVPGRIAWWSRRLAHVRCRVVEACTEVLLRRPVPDDVPGQYIHDVPVNWLVEERSYPSSKPDPTTVRVLWWKHWVRL